MNCNCQSPTSHSTAFQRPSGTRRPGSVLIFVLLVIATLSLGFYTFSEQMLTEYTALRSGTDAIRSLAAAESGVSLLTSSLDHSGHGSLQGTDALPSKLAWSDSRGTQWSTQIVSGPIGTPGFDIPGPLDECSKLNLNSLALDAENVVQSRQRLMALPGVTAVIADSILDWLDADEDPRTFGAESNWYLSKGLPYVPRQGHFRSLQEVAMVRGVQPEFLFGADQNASGWLEHDELVAGGDSSEIPSYGWSQWITVHSAESNLDSSGRQRTNINRDSLPGLFRQIEKLAGKNAARFIVAMRMNGPLVDENAVRFDSQQGIARRRASAEARALAQTRDSLEFGRVRPEIIDGFQISRSPVFEFASFADLIDRKTQAIVRGKNVVLESPWSGRGEQIATHLRWLNLRFALSDAPYQLGRINLRTASPEVLATIPGLTQELARTIVRSRSAATQTGDTLAWIYTQQIVTLAQLRQIATYANSGGDVFSGTALGSISDAKRHSAVSFLIDSTGPQSRVVEIRRREPFLPQTRDGMQL